MIIKGFYVDKEGNVTEYFDNSENLWISIDDRGKPTGEEIK